MARGSLQFTNSNYVMYLPRLLVRFRRLTSLSLAGCTELSDSALTPLQSCGSNLRKLKLDCCFGITDNGLALVSRGCPSLVSISLYRCNITDTGLESLAKSCSALEHINLSYCILLSDHGVKALCRECCKIRALSISYCRGISGVGFQECSATLTFVEADSCLLTSEGVSSIVSGGGLEYLDVSSLRHWVCGDGLDGIGSGFGASLRFLNLRMCRFVGDESVAAIARGCPLLQEWSLAVCHEVKFSGWEAIGSHCHNLKVLHVNRCRNLCDRGLQGLRDGCERLVVLYMYGCRQISCVGLESFKRARGGIEIKREECPWVGPSFDEEFFR
eukprot:TRINITY_DN3919_c0_g1_i1.p1 TRINITY_DN3919_c0_g1~~TRINITY_DN3919_c0_g1_i1.p1  ORF type:complete len:330 (+),score=6.96 TRINITY_DN3919_c0_g1_i1:2-991(+)